MFYNIGNCSGDFNWDYFGTQEMHSFLQSELLHIKSNIDIDEECPALYYITMH